MIAQEQEQPLDESPAGWAKRWNMELAAAKKEVENWHVQGTKILKRFLDEREASTKRQTRWNLYTANVQTQRAMMFGKTPSVSVQRRFADSNDDEARVAGMMLERLLNTDIERKGDTYSQALGYALDDRLLPGLGCARLRYVADFEKGADTPAQMGPDGRELAPAVPGTERVSYECVETDYVHWRDFLIGAGARVWHEVRWVGFRVLMTREELEKRFGKEIGKLVPLNAKSTGDQDQESTHPWARAEVWEIWSKEHGKVFWAVENYASILEVKEDTLGLEGFWPCARPMLANVTTDKLVPRPDFVLAEDLYNEIDTVSTRVTLLERAIRVVGAYDKASGESLGRMLRDVTENEMIPVDNWAMFAEKGGIRGIVDWLPLDQIVMALTALRDYRTELVQALYQVTGMSDIMRGQAAEGGVTATEQSIKAKYGSVRMQALQDEFARFATELQQIKAEIIAKHFQPQTIIERSNVLRTTDEKYAMAAVQLIKSELSSYRVEVKPEAISLTDFAALKQERMEVIQAIGGFLQAAAPLAQQSPAFAPYLLQILQWALSGLRGASTIEGVLDQAIAAAQQQAEQPQPAAPDPKLQSIQLKGQLDMQKVQADLQADLVRTQAEVGAEGEKQRLQTEWNVKEHQAKERMRQLRPQQGPTPFGGSKP